MLFVIKKSVVVVFIQILGFSIHCSAQCNDWEKLLAYEQVYISDLERDRFGNMYVVGWFNSPNFSIGSITLPLYGDFSLFVLKFDKNFSLLWGKSAGNNSIDLASSIEIDNDDNPIVAGYFYSTSIEFDCITLYKSSRSEMFLVKYGQNGNVHWAKGTAGLNDGFYADISITPSNDIVLTSTFVTGNVTLGGKSVQGKGGYDSFVASVTTSGDVTWMKSFGGLGGLEPDYIQAVDTDVDGNILVTGFFASQTMAFDQFLIPRQSVSENLFVAKLSQEGNTLWAKGAQAPVNNGGYDIGVDKDGNICVVGRYFGGDTQFGSITLTNQGEADIFIVKYNAQGDVLDAKTFGGPGFDTAGNLGFDAMGNIIVAGYFYSNNLPFDSYTLNKADPRSDVFVVTLDEALVTQCVKHVSGVSESLLSSLTVDRANNIWLVVDNVMGSDEVSFDGIFTSTEGSMIAGIGNTDAFDIDNSGSTSGTFDISLGTDLTCFEKVMTLDAGNYCNAYYTWNNGSHDRFLVANHSGEFWVKVEWEGMIAQDTIVLQGNVHHHVALVADQQICEGGTVKLDVAQNEDVTYKWDDGTSLPVRTIEEPGLYWINVLGECETKIDTILVTLKPPLLVDLGNDEKICKGGTVHLDVTQNENVTYNWDDGTTLPERTIYEPGLYWIKVQSECGITSDSIVITFPPPLLFDLGKDTVLCAGNSVTIGGEKAGALFYRWQDNSTSPALVVNETGQYEQTISNGCEEVKDDITITFIGSGEITIPNVVTDDGNSKNDKFILPSNLGDNASLVIFNRWGQKIFSAHNYQNNWPINDESTGVYFYSLKGGCLQNELKGNIHLMR